MGTIDYRHVIETQQQDWNRVAAGWEKWDALLDQNLAFVNYRLLGDARIRPGQRVVDVGSGTGYPALLAAQAVGPHGRVQGFDLAEAMLDRARCKAQRLGLSNVTFQAADATTLPIGTDFIDAVISRFCLMFLPDIPKAVGEIMRVLVPGAYVAAAVWSAPDRNPFLKIPMDVLKTMIELPPPDPEQPGIFRLAAAGDLASIMSRAGLPDVRDDEIIGEARFDSPQQYLESVMDQAAPLQALFARLTEAQRREAQQAILRAAEAYQRGQHVRMPMAIRIVSARKERVG